MIHQYSAALFCTVGLVLFGFELIKHPNVFSARYFSLFYSIAMLGWIVLGCSVDSAALVSIGTIQFGAALFLYFHTFRRAH